MSIDKEQALGELDDWMRGVSRALETAPEQLVDTNGEVAETVADLCEAVNRSPVEAAGLAMIPPVPDLSVLAVPDPTDSLLMAPVRKAYDLPEGELVQPERFKGEILTNETGGEYTFQEVLLEASGGAWATFTGARTGTAYEMNLNDAVEVGKVVEITEDSRAGGLRAWTFRHRLDRLVRWAGVCTIGADDPDTPNPSNVAVMFNKRAAAGSGGPDAATERRILVKLERPVSASEFKDAVLSASLGSAYWKMNFISSGTNVNWWCAEQARFITEDFDPETVTWNTKPDVMDDGPAPYYTASLALKIAAFVEQSGEDFEAELNMTGAPSGVIPLSFEWVEGAWVIPDMIYGVEIRAYEIAACNSLHTPGYEDILVSASWSMAVLGQIDDWDIPATGGVRVG